MFGAVLLVFAVDVRAAERAVPLQVDCEPPLLAALTCQTDLVSFFWAPGVAADVRAAHVAPWVTIRKVSG